jgi:DNA (cytosine-5)-methyltransferase 1
MKSESSGLFKRNSSVPVQPIPKIGCVDLFCGLGGLTHGFIREGISVLKGIDIDPQCRFPYEANNPSTFVERDVESLTGKELAAMYGDVKIRILAGCAPCQPFSTYSQMSRKHQSDSKWSLVADFGRLVREVQPDIVTMENVPQLVNHSVFSDFLRSFRGYEIWWKVLECANYGVPQTRKRLVFLASRFGKIEMVSAKKIYPKRSSVRDFISNLPPLEAGACDPKDPIHAACSLSDINLRRIRASKPGGTWRDWDDSLIASCHKRELGKTFPSVYGRMEWDAPAPTITTQCFGYGNGRFGHPEQDRAITLREAAILQTFPRSYRFLSRGEPLKFSRLGRLIGNAVPVRLAQAIARSFLQHLKEIGMKSEGAFE